jgi:putative flavoprotein involved in K+ transport
VLTDGTTLDADVVVLATGFRLMGETIRAVLGDAAADRCGPVWGMDAEGEIRAMWRPTGQPGLWLTGANLAYSRYYGKLLAIQIAARLAGLVDDGRRS